MIQPTNHRLIYFTLTFMLVLTLAQSASGSEEELWQYRNLGKAFYENPTTQFQAVEMFNKALNLAPESPREKINYGLSLIRAGKVDEGVAELLAAQKAAPEIPHTWFNLGIIYKKKADYNQALEQFEKMVELVPDEAISRYNLGVILKLLGRQDEALEHFLKSSELNPNLAGPHFQIYSAYRAAGREEDAARELKIFQEKKQSQVGAAIPEDLEWSYYSEILDDIEPSEPIGFTTDEQKLEVAFQKTVIPTALEGENKGQIAVDLNNDSIPDLLSWSDNGVLLHLNGTEAAQETGLEGLTHILSVSSGDFDNDSWNDLLVLAHNEANVFKNNSGKFEKLDPSLPSGDFSKVLWHDFDHDSDLDLFLFGDTSYLIRNDGAGKFSDQSTLFPFVEGSALDATQIDLIKDTDGSDLLVLYKESPAVLYRDGLGGRYQPIYLSQIVQSSNRVWSEDLDNDGWTDLITRDDSKVFVHLNRNGEFEKSPVEIEQTGPVAFLDVANRGIIDLVIGNNIYANQGMGRFSKFAELSLGDSITGLISADFNWDGRVDLAAFGENGKVSLLTNKTEPVNNWIKIRLEGVRNSKLSHGAELEVKSGSLYQKRYYSGGPVHFGLGSRSEIDTVRITWPNGLIQNEPQQEAGDFVEYAEKQRLSGSCPMVFTWNGEQFQFISDVLAVAPLGAAAGVGQYFQVDHDEYLQIPGEALVSQDGTYEIRITEELRETGFLDQVKLYAVDHPSDMEIFTSEKFKSPPFPDFRLYGISNRTYPTSARNDKGEDILHLITKLDNTYPSSFERDYTGVAEMHSIEIDFGEAQPGSDTILVLSGWVDFADGSTILRSSQNEDSKLVMPYLQVRNSNGDWQTVIDDMGIPAGKPKTIVVDMAGRFLSDSREIRIITNLCVYWDEIYLSNDTKVPAVDLVEIPVRKTDLRFRGFSAPVVHPERKQPEHFEYSEWMPVAMWDQAEGFYTRYGAVDELIRAVDDRYIIMGPGDELQLLFDGRNLPEPKIGYKRTFLLFVDGWAKDGDLNTAHSKTVGPLPFHSMSSYPYPANESYPDGPLHQEFIEQYNTRPALRLIRPLNEDRAGVTERRQKRGDRTDHNQKPNISARDK